MRMVEGRATVEDLETFLDELAAIGEETGCAVQAFDARYVVDREHLERSVELADRAFERGENVARDRGVEILLYAAGRRQIDQALEMGVGGGTGPVVVVVHGLDERADEAGGADRVAALLDAAKAPDSAKDSGSGAVDPALVRAFYEISADELAATAGELADVVHERVALLDVEK